MPRAARILVGLSVALLRGWPAGARAEGAAPDGVVLEWHAPAGCPEAGAVLARVRELLASSARPEEPIRARGAVGAPTADRGWQLALELTRGERTFRRSVTASSCDEAADAGALILALAVDPNLAVPESAPTESAAPPIAAKPVLALPAPAAKPLVVARPEAAFSDHAAPGSGAAGAAGSGLAWAIGAGLVTDFGSLPRPALGAQASAGLDLGPAHVEIVGLVLPSTPKTVARGRGGEVNLVAAGARACYAVRWSHALGRACAGGEGGRVEATGFGAEWTDSKTAAWAAGRLGAVAAYLPATALALRGGLELLVPATRPEFFLENVGSVHRARAVVGRLELGLELTFE